MAFIPNNDTDSSLRKVNHFVLLYLVSELTKIK